MSQSVKNLLPGQDERKLFRGKLPRQHGKESCAIIWSMNRAGWQRHKWWEAFRDVSKYRFCSECERSQRKIVQKCLLQAPTGLSFSAYIHLYFWNRIRQQNNGPDVFARRTGRDAAGRLSGFGMGLDMVAVKGRGENPVRSEVLRVSVGVLISNLPEIMASFCYN